jgi:hypothetical protein
MNIAMQHHLYVGTRGIRGTCGTIFVLMMRAILIMLISAALMSCSSLLPKAPIQPTLYVLDTLPATTAGFVAPYNPSAPTLTVTTPVAAAGFGGIYIIYQRQAHEYKCSHH